MTWLIELVVLAEGDWCDRCGRPLVFDGGQLCEECAWMRGKERRCDVRP